MADLAPISPDQQELEEFEFRARAEEEARARLQAAQTSEQKTSEPSTAGKIVGAAQTAWDIAQEHPSALLGAAGLWKANKMANAWQASRMAEAEAARESARAAQETAKIQAETARENVRLQQQRMAERVARTAPKPVSPQILGPGGQPLPPSQPVAPQPMPAQAANAVRGAQAAEAAAGGGNWMSQALNMARQYAPAMARAGTAIGGMLYSPSLGPAVPGVGRMRGMEINPMTGREWTREQIAAYEANPAAFDAQLPPPQMPR
jgi:hypothetical protein